MTEHPLQRQRVYAVGDRARREGVPELVSVAVDARVLAEPVEYRLDGLPIEPRGGATKAGEQLGCPIAPLLPDVGLHALVEVSVERHEPILAALALADPEITAAARELDDVVHLHGHHFGQSESGRKEELDEAPTRGGSAAASSRRISSSV